MGKGSFIRSLITNPADRMYFLSAHGFYHSMSDEEYIRKLWKYKMDYEIDLDNPRTLCEKLQWLKLYDHNPYYTQCADKYAVKQIVSDKVGSDYVIPLIGAWDSVHDIEWEKLPKRFILKATHDSGSFMICKDKANFDIRAAEAKFDKALGRNFYWSGREWQYKNVPPRIIAEEYIESLGRMDSTEYKITCMNGEVKFTTVCGGIAHSAYENRTNDHFNRQGHKMEWYAYYKPSKSKVVLPPQIDELIDISEKLAEGIPYVRVDFYIADSKIYFGEMTFCTWDGFMKIEPPEWDMRLGDMLMLPDQKTL